jgi:hypothetical protein
MSGRVAHGVDEVFADIELQRFADGGTSRQDHQRVHSRWNMRPQQNEVETIERTQPLDKIKVRWH